MEEKRGISSGVSSEAASNSGLSGEKRNGDGLEEKDELGSKRAKVRDLVSDAKSSQLQSVKNIGVTQQPSLSSENMSQVLVPHHAEGLGRVVRESEALAKDIEPTTVVRKDGDSTCLPTSKSVSKDGDRCVANSGKQALPENRTVIDDSKCESRGGHVDAVSKNSKPKEISESGVSPRDPSATYPISEKAGPFQLCSAAGSSEKSDSMRRWMEMKRNGFLSGPLGGVSAPSSAVTTTPVEVPPQKQQKSKRRSDSFKKRNEVPRKEQNLVDRFANVTAPSGLLTELNPGIINHVRSKKQVCSIIEALIRNATDDAIVGERNADLNVRGSVREDRALAFKLPSTGVSDHANSFTNPEQATSLAVEAATIASQWLDFLHQDLSGRLAAVQDSRNRVHSILTTELPHLVSSTESSSQESTLQLTNTNTSGDVSSDKTVTETHQIKWSAKFYQIKKALCDEEKDLERSLNQVKEMQSRCNDGLRQMDEYSPFSSQSSDSSFGKDGSNLETSLAVQAAAASIFSTCSFLLSMMKPPATSS